jgi:uncharacterized membrane protein YfcA
MWDFQTLALVCAAFLLGGFVKGVIGLGFPIVVLACLAATVGLKEAMGLLIVPGIITNIWQALVGGAFFEIVRRHWLLMVASVIGIWAGVRILASADTDILIAILGTLLFIYSIFSLNRPQIAPPGKNEFWLSPVMGGAGGFMFGLTGSYMVPGVLYIQALGLPRDTFVQMLGIIFCLIMLALAVFMSQHNIFPMEIILMSAGGLIPTAGGMLLGQTFRHRLSEEKFRKVLFVALCFAGIYMVVRAIF